MGSVKIAKLFTEHTHAGGHFSHYDDMFNYFLAIFCVEGEKRKSLFLYQFIQCNILNIRMLCKSTANISTRRGPTPSWVQFSILPKKIPIAPSFEVQSFENVT